MDTSKTTLLSSSLPLPSRTLTFDDLGFTDMTGWEGGGGTKILDLNAAGDYMKGTPNCVIWRGIWQATSWAGPSSWPSEVATPGYYLGVDSDYDSCTITLSGSVLAIVARVNTFTSAQVQSGTLTIYDNINAQLSCTTLPVSSGATNSFRYVGFQTKDKPISKFTLYGGYSVLDNLQIVACQSGYSVQSGACLDDDECNVLYSHDCHYNAVCQNTPGSYTCTCQPGTVGTGHGDDGCVAAPMSSPISEPLPTPISAPLPDPPTAVPTSVPVYVPVTAPASVPTSPPMSVPVIVPVSDVPIAVPTSVPISVPISSPDEPTPTETPTSTPLDAPMDSPISEPVAVPVTAPVSVPTSISDSTPIDVTQPADKGSKMNNASILSSFTLYLLPLGILVYIM